MTDPDDPRTASPEPGPEPRREPKPEHGPEHEPDPAGAESGGDATPPRRRGWGPVISVALIFLIAAGAFGFALYRNLVRAESPTAFVPSEAEHDPSRRIPGIEVRAVASNHVKAGERVAYRQVPPSGGAHDPFWAACTGVVYDRPVRVENLVHSLEHGAAWIAYNPEQVSGPALAALDRRVRGVPYTMMAPFPGLDRPISLQTWGHQLKVSDAEDPRIDQFLVALRANKYTHPEFGASCHALGPGQFDQDNPPPFQPIPSVAEIGQPGIQADAPPPGAPGAAPAEPLNEVTRHEPKPAK